MARPLDCLIGDGLAPSPYDEACEQRDAAVAIVANVVREMREYIRPDGRSKFATLHNIIGHVDPLPNWLLIEVNKTTV